MYDRDFNYFINNQIGVSTTNNGKQITFFSRLIKECFKRIDGNRRLSDDEITEHCFKIHQTLKYYN